MERIRELRKERGLSQQKLADLAGLSINTISNLETRGIMSLESIEKVAKALEVHPSYLCYWSDSKDGCVKIVEKVVERVVEVAVHKPMERIPNYWKPDDNGQIIRWTRRGKPV